MNPENTEREIFLVYCPQIDEYDEYACETEETARALARTLDESPPSCEHPHEVHRFVKADLA